MTCWASSVGASVMSDGIISVTLLRNSGSGTALLQQQAHRRVAGAVFQVVVGAVQLHVLISRHNGFSAWWELRQPEVLATECRVYHKILRYAGTADLLCVIGGRVTLVDYKSSAQVRTAVSSPSSHWE